MCEVSGEISISPEMERFICEVSGEISISPIRCRKMISSLSELGQPEILLEESPPHQSRRVCQA